MPEKRICWTCYGPIEPERTHLIGPSVTTCSRCAQGGTRRRNSSTHLLRCVIFDDAPKQVIIPNTVVDHVRLNVTFAGEIWPRCQNITT